MNAVVERSENSEVTLKVEVEPERLAKATDKAYQRLVQRVNIPGFRRGKAPRRILERTVGLDALYREALDFVMPSAYEEAVRESRISPYARPEFEVVQLEPDKALIFKATVPVDPSITLGDYHALDVKPEESAVTDDEVRQALTRVQEANAQWIPVEDRPAKVGDQVGMDLLSSVDGKPLGEGVRDAVAELDSDAPYPRWANAMAGLSVGDQKQIEDTIPQDARGSLAGKTVTYNVTVESIKEKELPAIDDELARSVGAYDSLEDLKADLRRRLEEQKQAQAKAKFEGDLVARLVEATTFQFPELMVEQKLNVILREAELNFRRQGFTVETFLRATNKTAQQMREEFRPQAVSRVKSQLVLQEVALREAVEVSAAEVDEEIQGMVESATPDRRPAIRQSALSPTVREAIRQSLLSRKALNRLDELAGFPQFAQQGLPDADEASMAAASLDSAEPDPTQPE
ncbi:MAG: trigger factor [Chloroflexota bacterium]